MYSEYFECDVTAEQFEAALVGYHDWCKENGQQPEISSEADMEDLTVEELDHVLYHAEMVGAFTAPEDEPQ